MTNQTPVSVYIRVDERGRGVFTLNGIDISHRVSAASMQTEAMRKTTVTFTLLVDELQIEALTNEAVLPE